MELLFGFVIFFLGYQIYLEYKQYKNHTVTSKDKWWAVAVAGITQLIVSGIYIILIL